MTVWTVTFQDEPEMVKLRAGRARRRAHVAFVRAHPELQIGGEFALTPQQDFPGAIWYVTADSQDRVREIVRSDPYFVPSLRRYEIRQTRPVFESHGLRS